MAGKLIEYLTIRGTLSCTTGLRIGGSSEQVDIGALENTIIRHPITDEPYIPGSSLKGKVRSLLEYTHGRRKIVPNREDRNAKPEVRAKTGRDDDGEPCGCGQSDCKVCRVFGPHKNTRHTLGPTRALFRDALLTPASREMLSDAREAKGIFFAEVKTENMVNRTTGTAEHPRTQERVPAGAEFDFEITSRVFDDDNADEMVTFVKEGLALLEQDYLGASGSRGYGKVKLDYRVDKTPAGSPIREPAR